MKQTKQTEQELLLAMATGWGRLERRLDGSLSGLCGMSFAEYRILRVLADAPGGKRSRVDLAAAVGLTPSGVTRALRPLEKRRVVITERSERDARLALASLTPAGRQLVEDASAMVDDVMATLMRRVSTRQPRLADFMEELVAEVSR